MKNIVCIDNVRFFVQPDSSVIRNEEYYCAIKDRMNRRDSSIEGGVDWRKIRNDAESLACDVGIDLIIACYYTVASFKTQGFSGLANGLLLMNAALLNQESDNVKIKKLNLGLVDWVKKHILKDISKLQPTYEMLRDLYMCERESQILDGLFDQEDESEVGCFEEVALEIYKHIDHLEMRYHTIDKVRLKIDRFSWNDASLVFATSLISVAFTFIIMTVLRLG